MSCSGWQWDPKDRPMFKDILISLENMFDKTNVNEGKTAGIFSSVSDKAFLHTRPGYQ